MTKLTLLKQKSACPHCGQPAHKSRGRRGLVAVGEKGQTKYAWTVKTFRCWSCSEQVYVQPKETRALYLSLLGLGAFFLFLVWLTRSVDDAVKYPLIFVGAVLVIAVGEYIPTCMYDLLAEKPGRFNKFTEKSDG